MKFIPLICFLLLVSFQCIGQRDPDKLFYAQKVEKYTRMKNTGTTLTITGGILLVVGISMMVNGTTTTNNGGYPTSTLNSKGETGAILYLLGVAGLGAGIPLWIVGAHNQHKYERKFESISLGLNVAPQRAGLTLRYRF